MDNPSVTTTEDLRQLVEGLHTSLVEAHRSVLADPIRRYLRSHLRKAAGKLHASLLLLDDLEAAAQKNGPGECRGTFGDLSCLWKCKQLQLSRATDGSAILVLRQLEIRLDLASHAHTVTAFARCLSTESSFQADDKPEQTLVDRPSSHADALQEALRAVKLVIQPVSRIHGYHDYRSLSAERAVQNPDYARAAARWPGYAEEFWDHISPAILHLFRREKSPEFESWLLEYCQQQWPELYGPESLSPTPMLQLMDAVSNSDFEPLHVAAALGLSKLCQELVSQDDNINRISPIGSPFYCALLGPQAFLAKQSDVFLLARRPCPSIAQKETIQVLSRTGRLELKHGCPTQSEPFSIATFVFLICLRLRSEDLFLELQPGLVHDERYASLVEVQLFSVFPWGQRNQATERFMRATLPVIYDDKVAQFEIFEVSIFLNALWTVMESWQADIVSPKTIPRIIPGIADDDFPFFVRDALRQEEKPVILRLLRDPRWDPNQIMMDDIGAGLGGRDDAEGTVLHMLAPNGDLDLVRQVVESGADVHRRDAYGRTPLMLCERLEVLRYLVEQGARIGDTDHDGGNIWHFAAANNDCAMLEWLLNNDPDKDENLQACTEPGRTPAAQAIAYPLHQIKESYESVVSQTNFSQSIQGALLLLRAVKGKPYLRSDDRPLAHVATEWGSYELLVALEQAGGDLSEMDSLENTALHFLNFAASVEVIRLLRKRCAAIPPYNAIGLTPAETIFPFRHPDMVPGHLCDEYMDAHPALYPKLKESVYRELVLHVCEDPKYKRDDPEFPSWKLDDEKAALFWPKFVNKVLFGSCLSRPENWSKNDMVKTAPSIMVALDCILTSSIFEAYERYHKYELSSLVLVLRLCRGEVFTANGSPWESTLLEAVYNIAVMVAGHSVKVDASDELGAFFLAAAQSPADYGIFMHQFILSHQRIPDMIQGEPAAVAICRQKSCHLSTFRVLMDNVPWNVKEMAGGGMEAAEEAVRQHGTEVDAKLGILRSRRAEAVAEAGDGMDDIMTDADQDDSQYDESEDEGSPFAL